MEIDRLAGKQAGLIVKIIIITGTKKRARGRERERKLVEAVYSE